MGFDGLFFARNDYDDKNQRLKDLTIEMVWRPSKSLGNASDLFTGIFLFHYGPPPGFCFDVKCSDPPIQVIIFRACHEFRHLPTVQLVYIHRNKACIIIDSGI